MTSLLSLPRLLIAGVSSGVGKTTFSVGLCRALRRRGLRVAMFKCGPDYLDPTYHRYASGKPVHNLDSWMMGESSLRDTFVRNAALTDISLIEGVMGMFDGASPTELTGSSAEIAQILRAPTLLVCDASGMARSIGALAHGFATFEAGVSLAGVICNRAGSSGHLQLLQRACESVPMLGGLLSDEAHAFPERHLGLRTAAELVLDPLLDAWADQVETHVDVPRLLELAQRAPALEAATSAKHARARCCRIGIAQDEAFHFYYDANLRMLEESGAELVPFSPLHDRSLPELDGVYIGGGYPELHAAGLASNILMRAALRAFASEHKPIYAECGGLMYLADAIISTDGVRHQMIGLIEGSATMSDKLQALGYVEIETRTATLLGPAGTRFRGHQFRYSHFESRSEPARYAMRVKRTGQVQTEGYGQGSVLASYVHAHWAGQPAVADAFVAACTRATTS